MGGVRRRECLEYGYWIMIFVFTALISSGLKGLRNQWYILFEIVIFWFRSVLPAFFKEIL